MIQLKGYNAGIIKCIIPEEMSEQNLLDAFPDIIGDAGLILKDSEVIMDMGHRAFSLTLISQIWKDFVEPSGCKVLVWNCEDTKTRNQLEKLGINCDISSLEKMCVPMQQKIQDVSETEPNTEDACEPAACYIYTGNVRGGQKIEHHGDLIILGHVHIGSEILATGNITVLGKLQGVVHAGYRNDNTKAVFVRSLETGQVRIGTKAGLINVNSEFWGKPVVVSLNRAEDVLVTDWPQM